LQAGHKEHKKKKFRGGWCAAENGAKPLVPWEEAKKDLDLE
jgi:hypothetical protein